MQNKPYPKPCNHRILIQIIEPDGSAVILPDGATAPDATAIVRACAPDVVCCVPGDQLVLMPGITPLGYDKERKLVFIHDSHVLAVDFADSNWKDETSSGHVALALGNAG